jgi:asparagine synthase (glutamine-hydrolysing)
MCAIHGLFRKDVASAMKMVAKAHHRGPDGQGTWHDEFITLGHNLLSIVDEEKNSIQPWEHNNLVLVYNGEIYNYKELGEEFDLKTNTDTEVIAKGIEKYGQDYLDKLDGMFGLAVYFKDTKNITLARDSNGTKPVYYSKSNGNFCFSSEIKSLLELGIERRVCKRALSHYHNQGFNTGYLTMFEGIQKLVPGEVVTYNVTDGRLVSKRNLNNYKYKNEGRDRIAHRFRKAVNQTLMGRRNIGLFLSGGIDSTSILYEMLQLGIKPVTFTSSFDLVDPYSKLNEDSQLAKQLCKDWGVENFEVRQTQQDYVDALDDTFYALEEPRQGKSFPTYYNTNKFMSQNNITVTLSGDGGDEIFGGYKHHALANWKERLGKLQHNNRNLKNPELSCDVEGMMCYLDEWLPKEPITGDAPNDLMYTESLNGLCDDFLIRNDKLGMAFSMEGRFPFMNKVIRDYVRGIPSAVKFDWDNFRTRPSLYNKKLQKEAYRGKLPNYIIDHAKTGWRFPTDEILIGHINAPAPNNGVLKDYIRETLKDKELQDLFEYTPEEIETKYLNNRIHAVPGSGKKAEIGLNSQKELFLTLNFAVWRKVFNVSI